MAERAKYDVRRGLSGVQINAKTCPSRPAA